MFTHLDPLPGGISLKTLKLAAVLGSVATLWLVGFQLRAHADQAGAAAVPTFTKDVAPILYKNCTACHRPGEIGPMSLLTYEDARPHAGDMRDEVMAGHMPPWHSDAKPGTFLNDRRLSEQDKLTIKKWADAGAPRGDMKDMPAAPKYSNGWSIGTPDVVYTMPDAYPVPASGEIEYQYFEVPTNLTEDKWVQAIEIRPEVRAVVHHVLVYARDGAPVTPPRPRALIQRADLAFANRPPAPQVPGAPPRNTPRGPLGSLIATTAPGTNAMVFRPGTALRLTAGTVLTFQLHYTSNGTAAKDKSSVGMVFAKAAPDDEIRVSQFVNGKLVLPAGAADVKIDSELGFSEDVHVYGLFPHTHLRGKRWEYRLVYPDGRIEPLMAVPTYDFNWQTYYMFATPLAIQAGVKIQASAWYDNSAKNPSNPDPKVDVKWGDQTWEEMQYTGITYTVDSAHKTSGHLAIGASIIGRKQ